MSKVPGPELEQMTVGFLKILTTMVPRILRYSCLAENNDVGSKGELHVWSPQQAALFRSQAEKE